MVSQRERAIYEAVLERDRWMSWNFGLEVYLMLQRTDPRPNMGYVSYPQWRAQDRDVCVAPIISGLAEAGLPSSPWGPCSGEMERDHVHTHTGGTKGKRALTTMETLVILCHHHHQDGWATSHRPEIREYIKEANERYRRVQAGQVSQ